MEISQTAVLLCALASGCGWTQNDRSIVPCDHADHAAQADLTANAARSKIERDACNGDATCIKKVLAERDAYVMKRCALPDAGAGGGH